MGNIISCARQLCSELESYKSARASFTEEHLGKNSAFASVDGDERLTLDDRPKSVFDDRPKSVFQDEKSPEEHSEKQVDKFATLFENNLTNFVSSKEKDPERTHHEGNTAPLANHAHFAQHPASHSQHASAHSSAHHGSLSAPLLGHNGTLQSHPPLVANSSGSATANSSNHGSTSSSANYPIAFDPLVSPQHTGAVPSSPFSSKAPASKDLMEMGKSDAERRLVSVSHT